MQDDDSILHTHDLSESCHIATKYTLSPSSPLGRHNASSVGLMWELNVGAALRKCFTFCKNSSRKRPTRFHLKEDQWKLSKLRCLYVKHISRDTGMQWRSARRRMWYTEGAASYLWQGKDDGRGASVCGLAPLGVVAAPWSVNQTDTWTKKSLFGSHVCACVCLFLDSLTRLGGGAPCIVTLLTSQQAQTGSEMGSQVPTATYRPVSKYAEVRELRMARRIIRQFFEGQTITSEVQLAVIFGRRVVVGPSRTCPTSCSSILVASRLNRHSLRRTLLWGSTRSSLSLQALTRR